MSRRHSTSAGFSAEVAVDPGDPSHTAGNER